MEGAQSLDFRVLYEEQKVIIDALRHELDQLKKLIFGSRSERFLPAESNPAQLSLGLQVEPIANVVTETVEVTTVKTITTVTPKQVNHPGRTKLPAHLRREVITLEPQNIPEGARRIGEEITEELEYTPGELYVNQFVRPKYVLPVQEDGSSKVAIAPMPLRPIEKAIAGPGLLAQVIIDKYVDHLPIYRQMQRFERAGVKIAYSTITDWVSGASKLITPLYEALKTETLSTAYVHADETPIKVLDKDKTGQTHRGYFWVYNNSPGKLVFFDYQKGRGESGPNEVLKEYKGYLQTDGYAVYDSIGQKDGITLLHCMAHARRHFMEARDNDAACADYVLERIQQIYDIERQCKESALTWDQRKDLRCAQALPILEELGKWMKDQYTKTIPRNPINKALAYSIQRWDKLCLYTTNGMLSIDNNPVENSIRPVAVGRKNYLFCGSHEAATRTAMLYSLLGTCKLHGVNPFTWLKDVLERIPTTPINRVKELLPHNWLATQN